MMVKVIRRSPFATNPWVWLVVPVVFGLSAYFGAHARIRWLLLPLAVIGLVALLQQPALGLFGLIFVALLARFQFSTGTEVLLNPATLLAPALLGIWILIALIRRESLLVPSRINKPLFFFLLMGLLSLLIGNAFWDPSVPRGDNFILVQLAQWSVFAFSAGVFWLTGSTVRDETWLRRLTFFFLTLAGGLALVLALPGGFAFANRVATYALFRAPFWLLLTAVAGGQLLFKRRLSLGWRAFCLASLAAVLYYAFGLQRERLSNMVGVAVVAYVLIWLRWPRLRWILILLPLLGATVFSSTLYNFAGGDAKWDESGASRGVLIGRVLEVSMRNPITGIGPAAYRAYARIRPLSYQGAYWVDPQVNSHNNYVDIFSQGGIVGLVLFLWFAAELTWLAWRLRSRFREGFTSAYVNSMLAAWAASLAIMLFADWILPFVYNIGFPGFQASILVWLFLGGLISLERIATQKAQATGASVALETNKTVGTQTPRINVFGQR